MISLWFFLGVVVLSPYVESHSVSGNLHAKRHVQEADNQYLSIRQQPPDTYVAAPYYPTPPGGWVPEWADAYSRAHEIVSNMTLAEKVNLTTGTGLYMGPCVGNTGSALRFGIPNLCLEDSALGVALTDHVTAFPAGITTGATFNKDLMYARGQALGAEARGKGVNIQLGPTVGPLGRKPRGGRNWEGFGADPVLQGIGGAQTIQGMQSQGVIATVKHFIGNEQEQYRMDSIPHGFMRAASSNIDDRTLHELYAWPFAEAVRVGVGAVMTAYNEVNGSACSQNSYLINGILKDELGFQGLVMTDWLSHIGGVSSALAGLDMSMPGDGSIPLLGQSYWAYELSNSILNGTVPVDRLNDMVTRIVATWLQMGQDAEDYPDVNFSSNTADASGLCYPGAVLSPICNPINRYVAVNTTEHADIARQVAQEAVTLLKNDNNTLPIRTNATLRVFGTDAQTNPKGPNACGSRACDEGVLGMGWGSGTANYPYLDSPIDALRRRNPNIDYYATDTFPSNPTVQANDIALVFINSDSGENSFTVEGNPGDRTVSGLNAFHNGDALVQAAAAKYSTVIVIAHTVGPILLEPWIDLPSVKACLFAHLPGQEAGESLTSILFGDVSPSGHLPYSLIRSESDYPPSISQFATPGDALNLAQVQDPYTEGLLIDYRSLQSHNNPPRYPFGHGLSYTTFSYTNATLTPNPSVVPLSEFPPPRAPKPSPPSNSSAPIPPFSEIAWSIPLLSRINRYLYPYLSSPPPKPTTPYPYPDGYTTTPREPPRAGGAQGGNPALFDTAYTLSVTVTNTGTRPGKAVAMLFVEYPAEVGEPKSQLRDFVKTRVLGPGEGERVELGVRRKDLSWWDVGVGDWRVNMEGEYGLVVGESVEGGRVRCWTGREEGGCEGL
ncbi:MAG: hypothetical protein Q9160_000705 [Pyrenula sp. 1 TL-2023]